MKQKTPFGFTMMSATLDLRILSERSKIINLILNETLEQLEKGNNSIEINIDDAVVEGICEENEVWIKETFTTVKFERNILVFDFAYDKPTNQVYNQRIKIIKAIFEKILDQMENTTAKEAEDVNIVFSKETYIENLEFLKEIFGAETEKYGDNIIIYL